MALEAYDFSGFQEREKLDRLEKRLAAAHAKGAERC